MRKRLLLLTIPLLLITIAEAQQNFWLNAPEARMSGERKERKIIPNKYRTVTLDTIGLLNFLKSTPGDALRAPRSDKAVLLIPMPDGSSQRFYIAEYAVMEPGLAAKYPGIKTFTGQGIDDRTATIKIDWTPQGFHAMILSATNGSAYIDPYTPGLTNNYISYYKKDLNPAVPFTEEDELINPGKANSFELQKTATFNGCIGDTLRRYRLAVACTGEYARAVGGAAVTKAQALSAVVTSINRVNGVYETELAIRLVLVNNNDTLIFTDPATDSFAQNNNGTGLLAESMKVCDSLIGTDNYDIGHTFSTGAGGVAGLRVVCSTNKARGVTGRTNPTGDPYDIDYVAHEMGHQFGATHTFNALTGNCAGNRSSIANAEPGSGSTIMAYAGICSSTNDLQRNSDPYFHPVSYNEITNFVVNGTGNTCGVKIATNNTPPVVNAGLDYIIPKSTPFTLTGSGSDPDGDPVTFTWDQMDVGGPASNWNAPSGDAPLFRFFPPTTSPSRTFPKLTDIINNTTTIGEILPNYGRTINFRFTARDNRAGGGGECWDQSVITVDGNSGPFEITAPNTLDSFSVGTFMKVKWNVANSNAAPVNCDSVAIELSLDGGLTFPVTLAAKTLNDGVEDIVVPNNVTATARVRIRALKNVFFDISNANFKIKPNPATEFVFNDPEPVINCPGVNPSLLLLTNGVNGFTTPITLSASNTPAGSTAVFNANPINPGSNVTLTLQGTIAPGVYDVTVTGSAGSNVKTKTIRFLIGNPSTAPGLVSPANNSTGNVLTPTFSWSELYGASSYNLQVSTQQSFSTTVQNITNITGTTHKLTTPLTENTQYYWRISANNTCGSGPFSNSYIFKTAAISCGDTMRSVNVPVTIPTTVSTVTSTLNIPAGGIIADVDVVGLKGTHSYVSDLTFTLTSPANTSVILLSGICGNQADFNINLDDEATSGTVSCPPTGGQVSKPLELLSNFDNQNSTGTWTLSINDAYAEDGGTLESWGLRICTFAPTTLPVTWLNFNGRKNADFTTLIFWSTAREVNSDHYEVERSSDGINFMMLGSISAGNNPNATQQYLFNDLKPNNGENYYRLKQVNHDGKYTYSAIIKINVDKTSALWSVYPNPAHDKTMLHFDDEVSNVNIRLNDASGKAIRQYTMKKAKAGEQFEIPLNNLAKGFYLLTVQSNQGVNTEKIIIQ